MTTLPLELATASDDGDARSRDDAAPQTHGGLQRRRCQISRRWPPLALVLGQRSSFTNEEVLTEFLEHSLRVPDLILLDKIFPNQEDEVKPPLVQISADDQSRTASPLVKSIISYIDGHYTEPITLNSIADWLERNPTYISYIFKKETNMKLFDYVMRVRIQRAQQLIASTSLSFSEIASQVGFDEYRSFVRAYQKIVGTSPRESIKKGGTDT